MTPEWGLNPFEIREGLKPLTGAQLKRRIRVLIPLKSGEA